MAGPRKPNRAAPGALHPKFVEMARRIGRMANSGKTLSSADLEILQRTYQRQIDVMEGRVEPPKPTSS
ncbi:MAG: hypothetical protein ACOC0J_02115, partial [Myxococcota bacterium]